MKEKAEEEKAEELQRVFPENLENWQNLGISQRHKLQITMKVGLSERDSHVTRVRHTLRHKFLNRTQAKRDTSQYFCHSNHDERSACSSKLNQAVSPHAKVLARRKSDEDASRSSSSSSDSVESGIAAAMTILPLTSAHLGHLSWLSSCPCGICRLT